MPPVPASTIAEATSASQRTTKPVQPNGDFRTLLCVGDLSAVNSPAGDVESDESLPGLPASTSRLGRINTPLNQRTARNEPRSNEHPSNREGIGAAADLAAAPTFTSSSPFRPTMPDVSVPAWNDELSPRSPQKRKADDSVEMLSATRPHQSPLRAAAPVLQAAGPIGPVVSGSGSSTDEADMATEPNAKTSLSKSIIPGAAHKHTDLLLKLVSSRASSLSTAWPGATDQLRDSNPVMTQTDPGGCTSTLARGIVDESRQASSMPSVTPTIGTATPLSSPAQQLGHVLAALHSGLDGGSQITIRLDPGDLGTVSIRILRGHDGTASVSVAVEKLETLRTFQTDLGSLHHALDRAGLPDQRNVALHLVIPDSVTDSQQSSASGGQDGQPYQGGARQEKQAMTVQSISPQDEEARHYVEQQSTQRWFRPGMNITA